MGDEAGGGKGGDSKGSADGGGFLGDLGKLFSGESAQVSPNVNPAFAPAAAGSAGASFAPTAGSAAQWTVDSPIPTGNEFSYLNETSTPTINPPTADAGAGTGGLTGFGAPNTALGDFTTSDAGLNTGSTTLGSTPSAGGSLVTGGPIAAGGTSAVASGAADATTPLASGANLSTPISGVGASSLAPAAASAGSTAPADATSSWGDKLLSGVGKSLTSNPLGLALGAAGLGYNILNGQKQTANQSALTDVAKSAAVNNTKLTDAGVAQVGTNQTNAAEIGAKGKELEQYLATGQLPPQYSQQVDQAINDAKTTAISNAAKNGQPTDPTKNTALAQQLAQIDGQRAAMTSKVAETLFSAGAGLTNTAATIGNSSASSLLSGGQNAAGLSGQLYSTLTGIDQKQSEQTAKAIAALAQSLNGGTPSAAKAA